MTRQDAPDGGHLAEASTFLFVPGDRPDRFDKAAATGADAVIVDLEDAVGADAKDEARHQAREWLADHRAVVRINGTATRWFAADLEAIGSLASAIVLPKAESADDIVKVRQIAEVPVIALIETARGVSAARPISGVPGVIRLALGNVDLAAELGVDPSSHAALAIARSTLVYASAESGCAPPIDGVTTAVDDPEALARDCAHGRELGFGAKLCIHPRQVAPTASALAPSSEEVAWAERVLAQTSGSVGIVDGHMIDAPVLARARRVLARSRRQ